MVVLLNSLPWVVTLILVYWGYLRFDKSKSVKVLITPLIILALFWTAYMKLQPSYLPKGEIKRSVVPQFEQREFKVKDVQPKPMSGEDRDIRRKEQYEESLPFIEKDVDNNK